MGRDVGGPPGTEGAGLCGTPILGAAFRSGSLSPGPSEQMLRGHLESLESFGGEDASWEGRGARFGGRRGWGGFCSPWEVGMRRLGCGCPAGAAGTETRRDKERSETERARGSAPEQVSVADCSQLCGAATSGFLQPDPSPASGADRASSRVSQ